MRAEIHFGCKVLKTVAEVGRSSVLPVQSTTQVDRMHTALYMYNDRGE